MIAILAVTSLVLVIAIVLIAAGGPEIARRWRQSETDLYSARRGRELSEFKRDLHRDGRRLRRELHDELDDTI